MARELDGSTVDNRLLINSAIVATPPFTMACWFFSDDATVNQCLMTQSQAVGNDHVLGIFGNTAGDPVQAGTFESFSGGWATTTTGYSTGTWHHACGVWVGDAERYAYIDGGSKGSDTTNADPSPLGRLTIGQLHDGNWKLDGKVCEAAVWDTDLNDAEVEALAAGFAPPCIRRESLVSYWHLFGDEQIGDEQDYWSDGNDLDAGGTTRVNHHGLMRYPTGGR